jgi:hypothetical protein
LCVEAATAFAIAQERAFGEGVTDATADVAFDASEQGALDQKVQGESEGDDG